MPWMVGFSAISGGGTGGWVLQAGRREYFPVGLTAASLLPTPACSTHPPVPEAIRGEGTDLQICPTDAAGGGGSD